MAPLGNNVDQNLMKRLFRGACIFFPLVLCHHCSLLGRLRKGREKEENGRGNWEGKERKETPVLVPFAFLSPSSFLRPPRRLLSAFTEKNEKMTAHSASTEADSYQSF